MPVTNDEANAATNSLPDLVYSVVESAKILRVSERYMRSLLAGKALKTIRVGSRVLIRRSELERFLAEREGK